MRSGTLAAVLAGSLSATAAQADIIISPRAWYLIDAFASGELESTNNAGSTHSIISQPFTVFMKGASVAYRSEQTLPNTTFTATALFGSDSKILRTKGSTVTNYPDLGVQQLTFSEERTPQRLRRRDFELTAQTRVNDLWSWMVGVRYERARVRFQSVVVNTSSNPFTGKVDVSTFTSNPFMGGYDLLSARAGVSLVAPLNDARTDMIYGNAMAFVGHRNNRDEKAAPQYNDATFIGPDIAVGYSHRFTNNIAVDLRYRAQFFFPVGGAGRFSEPKTTHGPSVGVSLAL